MKQIFFSLSAAAIRDCHLSDKATKKLSGTKNLNNNRRNKKCIRKIKQSSGVLSKSFKPAGHEAVALEIKAKNFFAHLATDAVHTRPRRRPSSYGSLRVGKASPEQSG
ncbi:MAG TPA: hypothetical protein VGC97_04135 [Pyrinomonadaceae bacterium]